MSFKEDATCLYGCIPRCCAMIPLQESIIIESCSGKEIVHGPSVSFCAMPWPFNQWTRTTKMELFVNEYVLVMNDFDPSKNRYEVGPKMIELPSAWERLVNPYDENFPKAEKMQLNHEESNNHWTNKENCVMLNADEYVIVADKSGHKDTVKGPCAFMPESYGVVWGPKQKSILIPLNSYIVVHDTNSESEPIRHVKGPMKFYPASFEEVQVNPARKHLEKSSGNGEQYHYECIHISAQQACHLQTKDGSVILLDEPQFYMPNVGEQVRAVVQKQVLLLTDFCIMKTPGGKIDVLDGSKPEHRSFFVKPFHEFLYFKGDENDAGRTILSTLPQFLNHNFMIRTSDNVGVDIYLRISYQIKEINIFWNNPIQFVSYIQNYVQDEFLDRFAKVSLRDFMSTFTAEAIASIEMVDTYFQAFGMCVLDIQILDFHCHEKSIEKMLEQDIHITVIKQNELRAVQSDVLIQEQTNEIMRKQKDLEVQMNIKENDVHLQKVVLGNEIRLKDMEIQIIEEKKRTDLLEVKRGNDLVEYEFRGKCRGANLREFMAGIDTQLSADEKVDMWMRTKELEQATLLYGNVNSINMQPPNSQQTIINFTAMSELNGPDKTRPDSQWDTHMQHNYKSEHEKKMEAKKIIWEKERREQATHNKAFMDDGFA